MMPMNTVKPSMVIAFRSPCAFEFPAAPVKLDTPDGKAALVVVAELKTEADSAAGDAVVLVIILE